MDKFILAIIIVTCIVCPPLGIVIFFGLIAMTSKVAAFFMGLIAFIITILTIFFEVYILLVFSLPLLVWDILCLVLAENK